MSCFDNIIGIVQQDNPCFSNEFSADAKISASGKYMDQLEEFPELEVFKGIAANERMTLEAMLTRARSNAIQEFKEELYLQLGQRHTMVSQAYLGNIGQGAWGNSLNIGYAYAGLALDMRPYKGATVTVTGVAPFFNFNGPLTVSVYRAVNNGLTYRIEGDKVTEFVLNVAMNNTNVQHVSSIDLETTDEAGNAYAYLFLYQLAEGMQPRDNSTSCGCGSKENILHTYLKPMGIVGNDINNIAIANRTNHINGLMLQVNARCTGGDFICENYRNNAFIKEAIDWQILRKAVSNALLGIITSDFVNRYTMSRREQISMSINILNSKFKKNVIWIADNMDLTNNDCFSCNAGGGNSNFSTSKETIYL